MEGFYAIYYVGPGDSASFGMLLHRGKVYAVDQNGGDVTGSYTPRNDGGIDLVLNLSFPEGSVLIAGQAFDQPLAEPLNVTVPITITPATLAGASQIVELPYGALSVSVRKKYAI